MTVMDSEENKRIVNPEDLSYVPLQMGATTDAEERASSEESQQGKRGTTVPTLNGGEWDRTGWNGRTPNGEEFSPLRKDPENPHVEGTRAFEAPINKFEPPDGGVRAWSVMLGSFFVNGILFGMINSYSMIYSELKKKLEDGGVNNASSKAALVGSLTIGTTFLLSPVAGILTEKIGIRTTTFLGGALAAIGMLLSSVLCDKVEALFLTYGIMFGVGASLAYTPSLVILGHYFKRYMGIVNGFATAGSSVFTVLMPQIMDPLLRVLGLENLLRFMAFLTTGVMACALLFKPLQPPALPTVERSRRRFSIREKLKEFVNPSIWRKKRYVVWASAIPLALFGYFVPYVHIGAFIEGQFVGEDKKWPIVCIAITSGIGRLIFGYIADLRGVDRILLQQISFISIGVLTMLLPVTSNFKLVLVITLGMGLFDGCFISLLGPIAFDICGRKDAAQAIGFLLGMCSIPLTAGPAIAGMLFDHTGSYNLAFFLAGVPPIVGALAMFAIKCVSDQDTGYVADATETNDRSRQPLAQPAWQNEGKELQDMSRNGEATKSP